ncbi:DUF4240 domain-containing protein [Lentzea aerocolonigenes]|uniref:DUF4240 domain-containing protein n=1 Tax=Lentzea aerocolonigenes TaxID=68170 RepID=UPI00068D732B|nr:DUF4240 domain-containing protein [Lentzea aerocolonigenes]MCP2244571.1 Protein of unknown function (DUF4240) [Lentzea aerocolonigenes]
MDLDVFWGLLDQSASVTSDQRERRDWLTSRLALLPPGDICGFETLLSASRGRVNTFSHWHAAYVLCDGLCSAERFFAFQSWLVGLGRSVLASVSACPDALAEVPAVRTLLAVGAQSWPDAAWPLWEGLDRVPHDAFFTATGQSLREALTALGHVPVTDAGPFTGPVWELDSPLEAAVRLPRLWELATGLSEAA